MLTMSYVPGFAGDLFGLGQDGAILDHGLVPFMPISTANDGRPVYISETDTYGEVLNYAAGGFHTSVSRGSQGGCKDLAVGPDWVSGPKVCAYPRNEEANKAKWEEAAAKYKAVYDVAKPIIRPTSGQIADWVAALREANLVADAAYSLDQVAPPREPAKKPGLFTTGPFTEPGGPPATRKSNKWGYALAGVGLLGGVGLLALAMKKPEEQEATKYPPFPAV